MMKIGRRRCIQTDGQAAPPPFSSTVFPNGLHLQVITEATQRPFPEKQVKREHDELNKLGKESSSDTKLQALVWRQKGLQKQTHVPFLLTLCQLAFVLFVTERRTLSVRHVFVCSHCH